MTAATHPQKPLTEGMLSYLKWLREHARWDPESAAFLPPGVAGTEPSVAGLRARGLLLRLGRRTYHVECSRRFDERGREVFGNEGRRVRGRKLGPASLEALREMRRSVEPAAARRALRNGEMAPCDPPSRVVASAMGLTQVCQGLVALGLVRFVPPAGACEVDVARAFDRDGRERREPWVPDSVAAPLTEPQWGALAALREASRDRVDPETGLLEVGPTGVDASRDTARGGLGLNPSTCCSLQRKGLVLRDHRGYCWVDGLRLFGSTRREVVPDL